MRLDRTRPAVTRAVAGAVSSAATLSRIIHREVRDSTHKVALKASRADPVETTLEASDAT
jgi:hypothetical protein